MLVSILILLAVSFVVFVTGVLLAPKSINLSLKEKHDCRNFEIWQVPHLFQTKWYEPNRLYVRRLVCYGGLGLGCGFILLFILAKFGLV
jgi:hypothetical protein